MATFKPVKRETKPKRRHINCDLSEEEYARVSAAAETAGVSIKSFARQSIFFAIAHMETEETLLLEHKP